MKAGHEAAYEQWLTRLIEEARRMPGYLGTNVQRPGPTGPREYTSVYRFGPLRRVLVRQAGLEVVG